MAARNRLRNLAPHFIDEEGVIQPFSEQVAAFAYGEMPSGDMFVLGDDAAALGVPEAGSLPVVMRQKTLRKIQATHEISLTEIERLPTWLNEHPLAMESITEPNGLVVVADAVDKHGNDIIVAMHLGIERQQVVIDEVASVYGKRNLSYLIENTDRLGKTIFCNERTGGWILRTGLQLPEQIANRLINDYTTRRGGANAPRTPDIPAEYAAELEYGGALLNESAGKLAISWLPHEEPEIIVFDCTAEELAHVTRNAFEEALATGLDEVSAIDELYCQNFSSLGGLDGECTSYRSVEELAEGGFFQGAEHHGITNASSALDLLGIVKNELEVDLYDFAREARVETSEQDDDRHGLSELARGCRSASATIEEDARGEGSGARAGIAQFNSSVLQTDHFDDWGAATPYGTWFPVDLDLTDPETVRQALQSGIDLYNITTGEFVFEYNDYGSIATTTVHLDDPLLLERIDNEGFDLYEDIIVAMNLTCYITDSNEYHIEEGEPLPIPDDPAFDATQIEYDRIASEDGWGPATPHRIKEAIADLAASRRGARLDEISFEARSAADNARIDAEPEPSQTL